MTSNLDVSSKKILQFSAQKPADVYHIDSTTPRLHHYLTIEYYHYHQAPFNHQSTAV